VLATLQIAPGRPLDQRVSAAPTWLLLPPIRASYAPTDSRMSSRQSNAALLVATVSSSGQLSLIHVTQGGSRTLTHVTEGGLRCGHSGHTSEATGPSPPKDNPDGQAARQDALGGTEGSRPHLEPVSVGTNATAHVLGCAALPSEVFSSPVMVQGAGNAVRLLAGCRDDHLYQVIVDL
jgi:hypothetical protein